MEPRGRSAVQSARRRRRAQPLPAAPEPLRGGGGGGGAGALGPALFQRGPFSGRSVGLGQVTWGRGFVAWELGKAAQRERRPRGGVGAERPAARTFGSRGARASAREAGGGGHPWEPEGVHGGTPPPGDTGGEAGLAEERATRCEGQRRTITEMDEGSRRGSDVTGRPGTKGADAAGSDGASEMVVVLEGWRSWWLGSFPAS